MVLKIQKLLIKIRLVIKKLEEVKPDFVKLMSDGFFAYPQPAFKDFKSISDLQTIEPQVQIILGFLLKLNL